jgi:hypothetical protein
MWVWDKSGNLKKNVASISDFWCTGGSNGGTINCGSNELYDTQVAYDPVAQRWLAATASFNSSTSEGDLYFAVSQTSDAAGTWVTNSVPNACSQISGNASFPFLDMPILGYGGTWVVVDADRYTGPGGTGSQLDALVIYQNSAVAQTTLPPTLPPWAVMASPFFASRPSRDVSTSSQSSYGDLFLVGSLPLSTTPEVDVAALHSDGTISILPNSPGVGSPASDNQVPKVSCGSNCFIELGDSRIANVVLQKGNDGSYYLLTSYAAEEKTTSTGEAMYYVGRAETLAGSLPSVEHLVDWRHKQHVSFLPYDHR